MEGATTNAVTFQFPFTLAAAAGDGCLGVPKDRPNSVYCSFTHSGEQHAYLEYKMQRINAELGTNGRVSRVKDVFDARTGKAYRSCQSMVVNPALKDLRKLLYPDGVKTISGEILDLIGLEGLAVLWMDDGCVVTGEYSRNRGMLNKYVSKPECEMLCQWIGDMTHARACPNPDAGRWRVRIEMGQMPHFVLAVKPFVHSSMQRKVTLVYQRNTASRRLYETSLNVPFVDEGDKATRARSTQYLAA